MPTFLELSQKPNTQKICLCELDLGRDQDFWTNWAAGIWYLDLDAVYDRIDSTLLDGVNAIGILDVGSVLASSASLLKVSNLADVFLHELSFFWDASTRRVYIHLENYDSPCLYDMVIGEILRSSTLDGVYGDHHYAGRLLSAPSISKSRDPLHFGKINFDGGQVKNLNTDGKFDRYGEDQDIFGNPGRLYLGFDDLARADFAKIYEGFIEDCQIDENEFSTDIRDKRKQLSRKVPNLIYEATDYPDMKPRNIGKAIPLGYGAIVNAPVLCINEDEVGPPADWFFLICDTSFHGIYSDKVLNGDYQVYVNDVAVTPDTFEGANAIFTITQVSGDYAPGDKVTVTYKGYIDDDGNMIENGVDVILDLMTTYYPIIFNSYYFNLPEWNAARGEAMDIGYHIEKPLEIWKIIEKISDSIRGYWLVQDDGIYTYRIYNSARSSVQHISYEELPNGLILTIPYEPKEVLTSCRVGHTKDWTEDEYIEYLYNQQEGEIFKKFKTYREKLYDTLLTNETDARTFAQKVMNISGQVNRPIPITTSMQTIARKIGDMITVEYKTEHRDFIGTAKCEIIGKEINVDNFEINLVARIVELIEDIPDRTLVHLGDLYSNQDGDLYNNTDGKLYSKTTYS